MALKEYYLFNKGKLFQSYYTLGAHLEKRDHISGVRFTVWAPNARGVFVVGNFNQWQGREHPLKKQGQTGVWTTFIPDIGEGEIYKYEIETQEGERILKSDPFAFYSEVRPKTASIVYDLEGYPWQDNDYRTQRKGKVHLDKPMLIYEVHLGSWKRRVDGSFCNYRELAYSLVPYLKMMGFTHLELLPVMEHPFDGSWGYQVTGYFSATSRYGTPHDLMYLIDKCHQADIAVIMDWVPGHFCKDAHGLALFDGTGLFEEEEHVEWGTYKFNFARNEVISFLISSALFWLDYFHVDGLRVDGVTSMLLLNYGKVGNLRKNSQGGYENLEAIEFLRTLNQVVHRYFPEALMIAEESTDWPLVTSPPYDGGLGFDYKWNMGWMNDTLNYSKALFRQRVDFHQLLTFSLVYAFSENFILPFSHDEVVHGKLSLINRMPGDYVQKFAGLRILYLYQLCHPGKKLLFMGGEFGQFIEWQEDAELDWFLLKYDAHRQHLEFVRKANYLYQAEKSLWQKDYDWSGFQWIDVNNFEQSIISFIRWAKDKEESIIILLNFQTYDYDNYRVGVPQAGVYKEIFNTDREEFGGSGKRNLRTITSEKVPWHGLENSITCTIPPLSGVIFKILQA